MNILFEGVIRRTMQQTCMNIKKMQKECPSGQQLCECYVSQFKSNKFLSKYLIFADDSEQFLKGSYNFMEGFNRQPILLLNQVLVFTQLMLMFGPEFSGTK